MWVLLAPNRPEINEICVQSCVWYLVVGILSQKLIWRLTSTWKGGWRARLFLLVLVQYTVQHEEIASSSRRSSTTMLFSCC